MVAERGHRLGQVSDKARSRQVCFEGFQHALPPAHHLPSRVTGEKGLVSPPFSFVVRCRARNTRADSIARAKARLHESMFLSPSERSRLIKTLVAWFVNIARPTTYSSGMSLCLCGILRICEKKIDAREEGHVHSASALFPRRFGRMQRTDLSKASGPTTTTHVSREKKTSNAEFLLRIVSAAASHGVRELSCGIVNNLLPLSISLSRTSNLESRISNLESRYPADSL